MSLSNLRPGQPIIVDEDKRYSYLFAENNDEIDVATSKVLPDMGDTCISFWYAIKDKKFIIKEASYFSANEKAANYLKSKGISGDKDNVIGHVHCEMSTKLDYTGKIIIADRRLRDYCITGNVFLEIEDWTDFDHPWWAYEDVKEYIIEHGDIIECIDHRDFVSKFRRNITHDSLFEIRMMIDPRFTHQIKEYGYDKQYWWVKKAIDLKNKNVHDLYLPYQDKYHGFFYHVCISKENDIKLSNVIDEFEYLSSIDTSETNTNYEEIKELLNTETKQGIMYTLLKHARGLVSVTGFFEAARLINELY